MKSILKKYKFGDGWTPLPPVADGSQMQDQNQNGRTSVQPPQILATVGGGNGSRSPSPSVSWSDDEAGESLENVVEFNGVEAPDSIQNSTPVGYPAHPPTNVPAKPRRKVLGYEPASAPGIDLAAVFTTQEVPVSVGGAVYYKPKYNYPTVGEIAAERSSFYSRPETPDIDRHRRLGQLRDYALTMRAQRSGVMVPMT